MPLHFSRESVVYTHFHSKGLKERPTEERLRNWDELMHNRYKRFLEPEMNRSRIPINKTNKSKVMLLAQIGARPSRSYATRVRRACKYYNAAFQDNVPVKRGTFGDDPPV